jgi:hypothetical protein
MVDDPQLRILLLRHARDSFRSAAVTRLPSEIDVLIAATDIGVTPDRVKGMLHELVTVGYLQPAAGVPEHLAVQGFCEITIAGLKYLDEIEVSQIRTDEQRSPVGFQIPPLPGMRHAG